MRARHCCRANPNEDRMCVQAREFQSTPGIAAGRIYLPQLQIHGFCSFNPRPALLPGESTGNCCGTPAGSGFNPRPALLPGESCRSVGGQLPKLVSIHARHCCRANRLTKPPSANSAMFQSTPGIAAGRIPSRRRMRSFSSMFQSTPGIAAGRISRPAAAPPAIPCFNPRPALLPGESHVKLAALELHAFQSTPGIAAGRIPMRCASSAKPAQFQSTPGIAAGRIGGSSAAPLTVIQFQSTPGIAAGRITLTTPPP